MKVILIAVNCLVDRGEMCGNSGKKHGKAHWIYLFSTGKAHLD